MAKEEIFIDNSDIGATLQDTMSDIVGIVTKANPETETITPTETPQKKQNINELLTKKETKSCHKNILIKKSTADKIKNPQYLI